MTANSSPEGSTAASAASFASKEANDTFYVHRLSTLQEVKDAMEWKGKTLWDTDACVEMDEEYPDYVAEEHRIPVCCYNCTGRTCEYLPSGETNPTFYKYRDMLKPERLEIPVTPLDEARAEISATLHAGDLTENTYCEILAAYNLLPPVKEFLRQYAFNASFTTSTGKELQASEIKEVLEFIKTQDGLRSLEFYCDTYEHDLREILEKSDNPEELCREITEDYEDYLMGDSGHEEMVIVEETLKKHGLYDENLEKIKKDLLEQEQDDIER